MSVNKPYSPAPRGMPAPDDMISFEIVSVEEAKKVLDFDENGPPTEPDWIQKRHPPPAVALLPEAEQWLARLPDAVRPSELQKSYPRIVNDLCRLWRQPARWERYMADLLIVQRGDRPRQGFAPRVASELTALAAHHEESFPESTAQDGRGLKP